MGRPNLIFLGASILSTCFETINCAATSSIQTVALDLAGQFNIKAASTGVGDTFADFDGSQRAYPVEWLPNTTTFEYGGIQVCL